MHPSLPRSSSPVSLPCLYFTQRSGNRLKLQNRPPPAPCSGARPRLLCPQSASLMGTRNYRRGLKGLQRHSGSAGVEQPDGPSSEKHFQNKPFSLPIFFGMHRANFQKDVVFTRRAAVLTGWLRCDVSCLPKTGSICGWGRAIRYGGAWIGGDKGFANMMQVSNILPPVIPSLTCNGLTDLVDSLTAVRVDRRGDDSPSMIWCATWGCSPGTASHADEYGSTLTRSLSPEACRRASYHRVGSRPLRRRPPRSL